MGVGIHEISRRKFPREIWNHRKIHNFEARDFKKNLGAPYICIVGCILKKWSKVVHMEFPGGGVVSTPPCSGGKSSSVSNRVKTHWYLFDKIMMNFSHNLCGFMSELPARNHRI